MKQVEGSRLVFLRKTILFLLFIQLWILPFALAEGQEHFYILSSPIEQQTKLTKAWASGIFGIDTAWEIGKAYLIYKGTGSLHALAGAIVLDTFSELPAFAANSSAQMQIVAAWKRRKDIQKIANTPGVNNIYVFTASELEQTGITKINLHSNSLVIIKTDGTPPSSPEKGEWIPIDDIDSAKLRLSLSINKKSSGQTIEIPMRDFFQGAKLDPETKKLWTKELEEWKRQLSFLDRHVTHKSLTTQVKLNGTILLGDKEIDINGSLAAGKAVEKVLGTTLPQKIIQYAKNVMGSEKTADKALKAEKATVIGANEKPNTCAGYYQRLAGKVYVRQTP